MISLKKCINKNCKRYNDESIVDDDGQIIEPSHNFCELFANVEECDMHDKLEPEDSDWHVKYRGFQFN